MNRRALLSSLGIGATTVLAGCLNFTASAQPQQQADSAVDAPTFTPRNDGTGGFILLRTQPQAPNGVFRGEEFEMGVVLGNTATETLSGEVTVELVPSMEDEVTQTARITVTDEDAIPAGAARFFRVGSFRATAVGEWELVAGNNIAEVHPSYDGAVTIRPHPSE